MSSEVLMQGLIITVVGMGLVSLAQAILTVAICVFDRAFRPVRAVEAPEGVQLPSFEMASDVEVAAVAAALQYLELHTAAQFEIGGKGLGSTLAADRGLRGAASRPARAADPGRFSR